jgi:hypothetical protein
MSAARANQYAGECQRCGTGVDAGAGFIERPAGGRWEVFCAACHPRRHEPLTASERAAAPARPSRRVASLKAGQLWQECRRRGCEEEPVCVKCEYCSYHCGCDDGHEPSLGGPVEPYGHGARGVIDP